MTSPKNLLNVVVTHLKIIIFISMLKFVFGSTGVVKSSMGYSIVAINPLWGWPDLPRMCKLFGDKMFENLRTSFLKGPL